MKQCNKWPRNRFKLHFKCLAIYMLTKFGLGKQTKWFLGRGARLVKYLKSNSHFGEFWPNLGSSNFDGLLRLKMCGIHNLWLSGKDKDKDQERQRQR